MKLDLLHFIKTTTLQLEFYFWVEEKSLTVVPYEEHRSGREVCEGDGGHEDSKTVVRYPAGVTGGFKVRVVITSEIRFESILVCSADGQVD